MSTFSWNSGTGQVDVTLTQGQKGDVFVLFEGTIPKHVQITLDQMPGILQELGTCINNPQPSTILKMPLGAPGRYRVTPSFRLQCADPAIDWRDSNNNQPAPVETKLLELKDPSSSIGRLMAKASTFVFPITYGNNIYITIVIEDAAGGGLLPFNSGSTGASSGTTSDRSKSESSTLTSPGSQSTAHTNGNIDSSTPGNSRDVPEFANP